MRKTLLAVCCSGLALAAGCGKDGTTVEMKKNGVSVTAAGGGSSVALPANFPKDVPIMPGGTLKLAMVDKEFVSVSLVATAPVEEVAKYYEANLKSQGWTVEPAQAIGGATMVTATKDKRMCGVQIAKSGDGAAVMISLRAKDG